MISKHFPLEAAVEEAQDPLNGYYVYWFLNDHIENDPEGDGVAWLKGYRPASGRNRRW